MKSFARALVVILAAAVAEADSSDGEVAPFPGRGWRDGTFSIIE